MLKIHHSNDAAEQLKATVVLAVKEERALGTCFEFSGGLQGAHGASINPLLTTL